MADFSFQKLKVYAKAVTYCDRVYGITREWPKEYLFDITSQFRRAALSIPLNIAEGTSRTKKEFARFLDISRGSCYECVALVEIATNLKLISETIKKELIMCIEEISKMLSGLKKSMNYELITIHPSFGGKN